MLGARKTTGFQYCHTPFNDDSLHPEANASKMEDFFNLGYGEIPVSNCTNVSIGEINGVLVGYVLANPGFYYDKEGIEGLRRKYWIGKTKKGTPHLLSKKRKRKRKGKKNKQVAVHIRRGFDVKEGGTRYLSLGYGALKTHIFV